MVSYPADLSFGFIKNPDYFYNPYLIKARDCC